MKKNGVKNVIKSYRNGVKIEMVLSDIFVQNVSKQIREKDQKFHR